MPESTFIQYGSFGLVALMVVFFIQIMKRMVESSITNNEKLVEQHEKATQAIIGEVRNSANAIAAIIRKSTDLPNCR